jgi:acetyl esterase/lipase
MLAALLLLLQASPVPARAGDARVERDVPCRTVAGFEQRLDAYLPPGDGPHPAVLLVHGGAWMHGDKRDVGELAGLLARAGFACFAPSYRLAPAHRWPAQLEDCLYAVQFVRANAARFAVDPARIGAMGFSAGGHLVAMLGVLDERRDEQAADPVLARSTRIRCVVNYFGPALLSRTRELDFDTQPPPELFGDAPDSAYAEASPVKFVSADDAACLLVHGDADTTVPVGHSHLMEEALREAGVPCELFVIPGGGHGDFFRRDPQGEYWKRTERFLAQHLRL